MPRLRTKAARERLLRHVRKQRLKYITVLPSLVTILNGVCGFIAIILASEGKGLGIGRISHFAMAGYMILLAMIADMLDGRLARMSQSTSSFGGQLDSLCDIISFGVAPAFLMLKVLEHKLELAGFAEESLLQRFVWLAAAAYISCAAIRLARFNVENEEDESAHMSFTGLPSPAAAGVIASLIIFHQDVRQNDPDLSGVDVIIYALPFLALGLGALMVSRIRYPHLLNQYIKGKKPFAHLIRVLLLLGLITWNREAALVMIFCGFAASSLLKWFYYKVIHRKELVIGTEPGFAGMTVDEAEIYEQDDSL
jgi:CDP-diacylglycerol--serine O-phosphatidyltransferase